MKSGGDASPLPAWLEALNSQIFSITEGGPIHYSSLGTDIIPAIVARLFKGVMNQEVC
jgi:hypothetical protein